MTKLIINADDFGYSKGVSLGIIEAYQNGVVTSATMMTNMMGAAHSAALAKENPGLGVGIHLVLDCGKPVHEHVPSLVNENGTFHKRDNLEQFAEINDIEKELTSQIEKFLSFRLQPTHLDSHHHVHSHDRVLPIVLKLAKKYHLPIRKVTPDFHINNNQSIQTVDYFNHEFYGDHLTPDFLIELLDKVLCFETVEMMTHPAYIDQPLLTGSSYALQRVNELAILTNKTVQKAIADKKIDLVTYKEITNPSY